MSRKHVFNTPHEEDVVYHDYPSGRIILGRGAAVIYKFDSEDDGSVRVSIDNWVWKDNIDEFIEILKGMKAALRG